MGEKLDKLKEYLFAIFLIIAFTILVTCFLFRICDKEYYDSHKTIFDFITQVGLTILTAGVFAATLKYFQFMGIFRKEINNIIDSTEFENKLQKSINSAVYSVEFLSSQKDINRIWKNTTICLLKSYFPLITDKVESKLSNQLFLSSSLSHYYQNYIIHLEVNLINETHLEIKEVSSYNVIRSTEDTFDFKFEYSIPKLPTEDNLTKVEIISTSINNEDKVIEYQNNNTITEGDILVTKYRFAISGSKEYEFKHSINLCYPITIDKEYEFFCERILENLTIFLHVDPKLDYIFAPLNNEIIGKREVNKLVEYSYKGILLPNNGFRFYFIKKNN